MFFWDGCEYGRTMDRHEMNGGKKRGNANYLSLGYREEFEGGVKLYGSVV